MSIKEFCVVMTTTDRQLHAQTLAGQIVQAQLAACVQLQPIQSFYVWQGQPKSVQEWLLVIKTRQSLYEALERFISAHHHYDTPEVLCLPVATGAAGYLAWIRANTLQDSQPST